MFLKKFASMLPMLIIFGLIGCQNYFSNLALLNDTLTAVKKATVIGTDKFAWKPIKYNSTKHYIYLTFDDGPQNGTATCLELCKKLGVKASFFMIGQHVASPATKKIVSNIRDAYPQALLCNHSSTHALGHYKYFYHHPIMAEEDFLKAQQTLQVPYKIIRLPGNNAWVGNNVEKASDLVKPVCALLDSVGYKVIGWDVEWGFNHKNSNPLQTPQKMVTLMDSAFAKEKLHTKNHLVVLTHDRMFRNPNYADSLAKFITLLKLDPKNVFETVDHYPGIKVTGNNKVAAATNKSVLLAQNLTKAK